jgi:hypothetical protein
MEFIFLGCLFLDLPFEKHAEKAVSCVSTPCAVVVQSEEEMSIGIIHSMPVGLGTRKAQIHIVTAWSQGSPGNAETDRVLAFAKAV